MLRSNTSAQDAWLRQLDQAPSELMQRADQPLKAQMAAAPVGKSIHTQPDSVSLFKPRTHQSSASNPDFLQATSDILCVLHSHWQLGEVVVSRASTVARCGNTTSTKIRMLDTQSTHLDLAEMHGASRNLALNLQTHAKQPSASTASVVGIDSAQSPIIWRYTCCEAKPQSACVWKLFLVKQLNTADSRCTLMQTDKSETHLLVLNITGWECRAARPTA